MGWGERVGWRKGCTGKGRERVRRECDSKGEKRDKMKIYHTIEAAKNN